MEFTVGFISAAIFFFIGGLIVHRKRYSRNFMEYQKDTVNLLSEHNSIESNTVGELQLLNKTIKDFLDLHKKRSW